VESGRRRLAGTQAIGAALARGEPLRLIVLDGGQDDASARQLLGPARAAGVPVQTVGPRHFERLCPKGGPGGAVALLGAAPAQDAAELLARPGAAWLLTGVAYPGNAGFAIRTAEVSGAAGVFLDTAFDHEKRREALRASMRADRFLPVLWAPSQQVVDAARPVLFVVGGEAEGIPESVLEGCDAVARIPMAGFIRSYNLQAAVAVMAAERMRQLEKEKTPG
jgi:tRNA G18 (ribose-2'-O)-methylase SpoU